MQNGVERIALYKLGIGQMNKSQKRISERSLGQDLDP